MEYIPDLRDFHYNSFHKHIATDLVAQLQTKEILLSRGGVCIRPEEAILLPANFIVDEPTLYGGRDIYIPNDWSTPEYTQSIRSQ